MTVKIIGLNHRTAPIEVREKLAFSKTGLKQAVVALKKQPEICDGVILSTCNRMEIYTLGSKDQQINKSVNNFLSSFHDIRSDAFQTYLYDFKDMDAVRHLWRVSASLDSQILGENQILAQVKEAYFKAREAGIVSDIFSFIFEEAIKIGKKARSQTQIGCGAVSISTAAVELAKKIFESLKHKKVLIIGAGKIGELSASYLYDKGAQMILVANRTLSRAQELAKKFQGQAIAFDKFYEVLKNVDIVISSTEAPHFLVTKNKMHEIILERRQRPIFFIDLGLPRNIDPAINNIDNVYVYNLDDLKKLKDANFKERLKEAEKVEQLINDNLQKVDSKLKRLLLNVPV